MPNATTKDECVQILLGAFKKHGKLTQKVVANYIHHRVVSKYFGNLTNFRLTYGIPMTVTQENYLHKDYTDEEIFQILSDVYDSYGKVTTRLLQDIGAKISIDTLKLRFGSMRNALEKAGLNIKQGQRKFVDKSELLKDIDRINQEHGYVSKPLMERYSSYSPKIVQRIWGSFGAIYRETGYLRNMSGYVATDDELKKDLLRLQAEFGVVTQDIVTNFGKFSTTTYKERFGSMNKAYEAVGLETRKPGDSCTANWIIKKYSEYLGEKPEYEKQFKWLRNPKNKYPLFIDAYFSEANVAVEYNGPQHYKIDNMYCISEEELAYRQWLDSVKYDAIREHGIHLVIVHYLDRVDQPYIIKSLALSLSPRSKR